jgi:hypothetical protein
MDHSQRYAPGEGVQVCLSDCEEGNARIKVCLVFDGLEKAGDHGGSF